MLRWSSSGIFCMDFLSLLPLLLLLLLLRRMGPLPRPHPRPRAADGGIPRLQRKRETPAPGGRNQGRPEGRGTADEAEKETDKETERGRQLY